MLLFKINDPHHFGTLHISLLSLFRAATMDDWTDLMYINMFGCDRYGYETMPDECVAPEGWGYFSCAYFVAFVLLGAQILLSLFIGVVTTAMAEAEIDSKRADKMNRDIKVIVKREGLSEEDVACAFTLFSKLDIDEEGSISFGELEALFRILGQLSEDLSEKQVRILALLFNLPRHTHPNACRICRCLNSSKSVTMTNLEFWNFLNL